MLVFDPTITTGNLLIIATILGGGATALVRHSYTAGKYSKDFENVHKDLAEIKETLKEQDREHREKQRADALADGLQLVLQQRVSTLEQEMVRARENLHKLANAVQIQVFGKEMA